MPAQNYLVCMRRLCEYICDFYYKCNPTSAMDGIGTGVNQIP